MTRITAEMMMMMTTMMISLCSYCFQTVNLKFLRKTRYWVGCTRGELSASWPFSTTAPAPHLSKVGFFAYFRLDGLQLAFDGWVFFSTTRALERGLCFCWLIVGDVLVWIQTLVGIPAGISCSTQGTASRETSVVVGLSLADGLFVCLFNEPLVGVFCPRHQYPGTAPRERFVVVGLLFVVCLFVCLFLFSLW